MKGAAKVGRKRYKKQILNKISNLSPEESKEFWKILRSTDKRNENCENRSINDLNSLANHFKTQSNPDIIDIAFEEHISTDMHNREQKLTENCTDGPICITKIKTITKKLKSGKSNGPD